MIDQPQFSHGDLNAPMLPAIETKVFSDSWLDSAKAMQAVREELAAIRSRFAPKASTQEILDTIDGFIATMRRQDAEIAALRSELAEAKRRAAEFQSTTKG